MSRFDEPTDRSRTSGTFSTKWNISDGELPMWVADMDFRTAPEIITALQKRLDNGVFGYTDVPREWSEAVAGWWQRRHNFAMRPDSLVFVTGIVPAISSLVRKLTTPAEKVLVQPPVYNIFYNSIVNNGRTPSECPLEYDGTSYSINWKNLEEKLSDPQVTLMILCNPHNPTGNIWTRDELAGLGEMCARNGVTVIADEIHCDITAPGTDYTPFASVSALNADISVTCVSASKAFNLAGLQSAVVYAQNRFLLHKVWRALNTDEIAEPNAFAVHAAIAAFNEGGAWLDELRGYLFENRKIAEEFIARKIPEIYAVPAKSTYLLWLDCKKICDDAGALAQFLRNETGLFVSAGAQYGAGGKSFLRMNLACPRSRVEDGLARLERGVRSFLS